MYRMYRTLFIKLSQEESDLLEELARRMALPKKRVILLALQRLARETKKQT